MRSLSDRALLGPNVWSASPVWELAFSPMPVLSHDEFSCLRRSFCGWLLEAHDSEATLAPCVEIDSWPRDSTPTLNLLGWLAMQLQRLLNQQLTASFQVVTSNEQEWLVLPFEELSVVRCVWNLVEKWWTAAERSESPGCIREDIQRLQAISENATVGLTTRGLMQAARARGIPVRRLAHESLIQLHYGAFSRRLLTTLTDRAAAIADKISDDKWLTKSLLRDAGFPVASGQLVGDADEAWRVAQTLGLPVVVKPRDDDFGHGVALHLTTEAAVREAFKVARSFKPDVLVERHARGVHHRLFVLHDRIVAAVRRDPAHVVGDGMRSIRALVEQANLDPRRNDDDPRAPLWKIAIGPEELPVLADQGLTPDSIPTLNQVVPLRYDSRTSYGGTNIDCTADVHPEVAQLVVDAVRLIGLDVAGVDLLAEDISQSPLQQELTFLEINTSPSVLLHMAPLNENPQPLFDWMIEAVCPLKKTPEFSIVLVTGCSSGSRLVHDLASSWPEPSTIGIATREGLWIGDQQLARYRADNAAGVSTLLWHPRSQAAICEVSRESLRNDGLPVEKVSTAIFLSADTISTGCDSVATSNEPHLKLASCDSSLRDDGLTSINAVHLPLSLLASHAENIVINVDDPVLAQWSNSLEHCCVISLQGATNPVIVDRLHRGDPVIYVDGSDIVLQSRSEVSRIASTSPTIERLALIAALWNRHVSVGIVSTQRMTEWLPSNPSVFGLSVGLITTGATIA